MEIVISGLTKRFPGGITALDSVNLTIKPGMFGLLGPNGAGKTTLMRILATLLRPDEGTVQIGGADLLKQPQAVRQMVGYLPQDVGFYRELTAPEYLTLVAGMKGIPRLEQPGAVHDVLAAVGLEGEGRKRVGHFSGGMKRRLGIAQALLGNPRLLIVDEPTVGLDPEEHIRFRNLLADISGDRIVLLSTHIVGDLENVCDRLAVLRSGRLIFTGQAGSLIGMARGQVWQLELAHAEYERIRADLKVTSLRRTEKSTLLRAVAPENPFGLGTPVEPTMEDGYLCLMGGRAQ